MTVEKARELILNTRKSDIDTILTVLCIKHEDYRKHYPDTPVTPGLALDILDHKEDGHSNEQLKRIFNLSDSQLNYALYNPVAIQEHGFSLARPRVEQELKTTSKSQTEIAEEIGVSQSYVHRIAKELGLLKKRKKRKVLAEEDWQAIVNELHNDTSTVQTLAQRYGISRDTIYKRLRDEH